ncbi:hypothetical protein ABZP36_023684 [Zizania latifolia]
MFDSLFNSKFYNKCKHAIKCTRTRLDLVRRKKQAMIKFLKKDVADLLANGLESHAYGRMEGLIVEMNQASCYDMIEQYCEYIVKQLNNIQKQSECPQEAMEAVSTLIFAAARFPDLPELCDVRHMFTERYGSSIEPFVSSEFVQRLQDKSFTNEEKLQVMQSIAEEFSVPFNNKALQQKISGVPQNKHDLPNKRSYKQVEVEASAHNDLKVDRHAVHERKSKVIPEVREKKQEMQIKPKDIHVIPDAIGQLGEQSRKKHLDIPYAVPPSDLKKINDQELKKVRKKDSLHRRELMNAEKLAPPYTEPKEAEKKDDAEKSDGKGYHIHRSCMTGGLDHDWGHADLGLKTLGLEKQEIEHSSRRNGSDDDYDQRGGYMQPLDGVGINDAVNNARHFQRISERRKNGSKQSGSASGNDYKSEEDETDNAIDFGNLLPRAPSSHRRHRSRSAHPHSGGCDDEERAMDKLLMHYSKKGIDREEHKTRTKSRTPQLRADQPADVVRERSKREGGPSHPPERTVSLPSESGTLNAKPKVPARSISMQPEKSRGNVHPSMPDFDELAARISALRKA